MSKFEVRLAHGSLEYVTASKMEIAQNVVWFDDNGIYSLANVVSIWRINE